MRAGATLAHPMGEGLGVKASLGSALPIPRSAEYMAQEFQHKTLIHDSSRNHFEHSSQTVISAQASLMEGSSRDGSPVVA